MTRKRLTQNQKLNLWEKHQGKCWRCGFKIFPSEIWHVGHRISLSLGGLDIIENMAPEHERCNMQDARETTTPLAAKWKRIRAKHIGIKKEKPKSKWKRKVNGQCVLRDSH